MVFALDNYHHRRHPQACSTTAVTITKRPSLNSRQVCRTVMVVTIILSGRNVVSSSPRASCLQPNIFAVPKGRKSWLQSRPCDCPNVKCFKQARGAFLSHPAWFFHATTMPISTSKQNTKRNFSFKSGQGKKYNAPFLTQVLFFSSSDQTLHSNKQNPTNLSKIPHTQENQPHNNPTPKKIAIIGGGLAGMSVAYHLLHKTQRENSSFPFQGIHLTMFDKHAQAGMGGASAVAGGLVHPFNPRGTLFAPPLGLSALEVVNRMIDTVVAGQQQQQEQQEGDDKNVVLRECIYRIATSTKHEEALKTMSRQHANHVQWLDVQEMIDQGLVVPPSKESDLNLKTLDNHANEEPSLHNNNNNDKVRGCAKWHNGWGRVIHVPSYLQGLWKECQRLGRGNAAWITVGPNDTRKDWKKRLQSFDVVVYAAGAGLFQGHDGSVHKEQKKGEAVLPACWLEPHQDDTRKTEEAYLLPVSIVRGQSLELHLHKKNDKKPPQGAFSKETIVPFANEAMLCGKYVTPLPPPSTTDTNSTMRLLIGATHEYSPHPWDSTKVVSELQQRSQSFASHVWNQRHQQQQEKELEEERITCGYRVQSHRGAQGRLPIVGRLHSQPQEPCRSKPHDTIVKSAQDLDAEKEGGPQEWIFTGLSGRGLLLHGYFGELLSDAILAESEEVLVERYPHGLWWKKKKKKKKDCEKEGRAVK